MTEEYFEKAVRRLEQDERWREEHPVRRRIVGALDRIIGSLKYLRNRLR